MAQLEPVFGSPMNEQCHEYDECEAMRPFVDTGKPVFNAKYTDPRGNAVELALSIYTNPKQSGLRIFDLSAGPRRFVPRLARLARYDGPRPAPQVQRDRLDPETSIE